MIQLLLMWLKSNNGRQCRRFIRLILITYELGQYTNIIAFEVIEHLDNGLEIVEKLKQHCKRLLITVPHNEPKGFWGEHHKLHGLTEKDFPGFKFAYISHDGTISDTDASSKCCKPKQLDDL